MQGSDDFQALCKIFFPGSRDGHPTLESWVAWAMDGYDAITKKSIKDYLETLFAQGATDKELEKIWHGASPSYDFSVGGHRLMFEAIFAHINQHPN